MLQRDEKFLSFLIAKRRSSSVITLRKKTLKRKSAKCISKRNIQELKNFGILSFGEV